MNKNVKNAIVLVLLFVLITSVSVLVTGACFAIVPVVGPSMEPTVLGGDKVFILKVGDFDRGDVVVFENKGVRLIKRIVAVAGDTVEGRFVDGEIRYFINDVELDDQSYIKNGKNYHPQLKVTVPENSFYYLGDNREESSDSHSAAVGATVFGSMDLILGKVLFKYNFDGAFMISGIN